MIKGQLFTEDFLSEGIIDFPEWKEIKKDGLDNFKERLETIFSKFPTDGNPNEDTTKRDLIEPILQELGWNHFLTEQSATREEVPDYLLFKEEQSKFKANTEKEQSKRYIHGSTILEAKKWDLELDRKENKKIDRIPSNQIIRYLTSTDVHSDGNIQWGILTNGRLWRLYYNKAESRSEDYFEIDLPVALDLPGFQSELSFNKKNIDKRLCIKVFYLLFKKESFVKKKEQKTFHQYVVERRHFWEVKLAEDLSDVVFNKVFPDLLNSLYKNDPEKPDTVNGDYLDKLKTNTLALLYRLLFVLYAEDRNLLPVYDSKYDDYGFRKKVREDIYKRTINKDTFSDNRYDYYLHCLSLFNSIDKGDKSIGLPLYNGGLFNTKNYPILNRSRIPDSDFAQIVLKLSHRKDKGKFKWINYRDLSVQQLGSIYERVLERNPVIDEEGLITVHSNTFARKDSGSYYTPQPLVNLIIERAINPLIKECEDNFWNKFNELKGKENKKEVLEKNDLPLGILNLKICDPAMGSGHFLVSLVDYLADKILETIYEVEKINEEIEYISPVSKRIDEIREFIIKQAEQQNWTINKEQLNDRQIIKRMILKRCVYGVDKNPMAVELAKVSLWLHTFTVGAPLSFLDHHLRCGNSLFGEWVSLFEQWISSSSQDFQKHNTLLLSKTIEKAKQSVTGMQKIEELADVDISEVEASAAAFEEIEQLRNPLDSFLKLYQAFRWVVSDKEEGSARNNWIDGMFGDPFEIASQKIEINPDKQQAGLFSDLLSKANNLIETERFMNWEVAFPEIWQNWNTKEIEGGFDAVIGNPPWDKMKFYPVEWFAHRDPEISKTPKSADRKKMIEQLKKNKDPLWDLYKKADQYTKMSMKRAREDGEYPLLSGGDTNLYSLFVERAHSLIKPTGLVGLLVPTGIATNKTASEFFKTISTKGRLNAFFDFENKKIFPDVHKSFKFCAYIASGKDRKFNHSEMAFYLHDVAELDNKDKILKLTHKDFSNINPNTGTTPIFKTRRDAEITRRIYSKFPIINDYKKGKVWQIKYSRMFDKTNDSNIFRQKDELESDGFYPVEFNKMRKGDDLYVPLYDGKMIWLYDHRASSVKINKSNLKVSSSSENTTLEKHKDPSFYPAPEDFVNSEDVNQKEKNYPQKKLPSWVIGFRATTGATNERTFVTTILPRNAFSNSLPILIPDSEDHLSYKISAPLILANLSSFVFDFVARQKIQATQANLYIVDQLPIAPPRLCLNKNWEKPLLKNLLRNMFFTLFIILMICNRLLKIWVMKASHFLGMRKTELIEKQNLMRCFLIFTI